MASQWPPIGEENSALFRTFQRVPWSCLIEEICDLPRPYLRALNLDAFVASGTIEMQGHCQVASLCVEVIGQ